MAADSTALAETQTDRSLWNFAIGGLIFGLVAGILNNMWILIFPHITPYEVPKIPGLLDVMTVTGFSFLGILGASIVYYLFTSKNLKKGTMLFQIVGVLGLLASLAVPLNPGMFLPSEIMEAITGHESEFMWFTMPMHFFAAIIALYGVPKFVQGNALS